MRPNFALLGPLLVLWFSLIACVSPAPVLVSRDSHGHDSEFDTRVYEIIEIRYTNPWFGGDKRFRQLINKMASEKFNFNSPTFKQVKSIDEHKYEHKMKVNGRDFPVGSKELELKLVDIKITAPGHEKT
ncbi:hypothetical protein C8R42DRAFT_648566 [Lentinula raphanica]|nr:hypothetical protein C8R42DRAFT_648566 [Lentinula raphanica]